MFITYQVEYTDPETCACSPIDFYIGSEKATGADYIAECEAAGADDDWMEMLHRGHVSLAVLEGD